MNFLSCLYFVTLLIMILAVHETIPVKDDTRATDENKESVNCGDNAAEVQNINKPEDQHPTFVVYEHCKTMGGEYILL